MIANPLTGSFGNMSYSSMLSFYDMVNKIKQLNRKIVLIAFVPENIYAIGPLNVVFRFEETMENRSKTDLSTASSTVITSEIASFTSEAIASDYISASSVASQSSEP